jgi:MgsA AAA+ ATPase C terminal
VKVQAAAMERYASQPDAAMYYLARMVEADEDPKFVARRMAIFASELKVPSGRSHAAPASLVDLRKLEDRVSMNKRMNRASIPPEAAILVEVGSHCPHKVAFDAFGPFKILWVITHGTMRRNFLWITLRKTGIYVAFGGPIHMHTSYHADGKFQWKIGDGRENIGRTDQQAIAQRFRSTSRRLHKLAADSQLHGGDAVNDFPELV